MTRDELIEFAAAHHHDSSLMPGQYTWARLIELEDVQIRVWRVEMESTVNAIVKELGIELEKE